MTLNTKDCFRGNEHVNYQQSGATLSTFEAEVGNNKVQILHFCAEVEFSGFYALLHYLFF